MKEPFDLLKNRYQNNLESMKGSEFVFDYIHLLCYKCHKINWNCERSYTDFPDWIENQKAAINPINKKVNKCFKYALTLALNHRFVVNKCNWEGINFPSEKNDWKNFDKNNVTIAPNALYVKKEKAYSEDITQIEKRKLFF